MKTIKNTFIFKIIFIFFLIGFGILTGYLFIDNFQNQYPKELNYSNKKILASKIYSNYAWAITFNGTVIFNDGTIYQWEYFNNQLTEDTYNLNEEDALKKFILNKAKKKKIKVTKKDLAKIENSIQDLENIINLNCPGADQGDEDISIWQNKKEIALKVSGDCIGENKTKKSQEILEILNKYL